MDDKKDGLINYITYLIEQYKELDLIKYNSKNIMALFLMLHDIKCRENVNLDKIEKESIKIAVRMNHIYENKKIYDRKIKIKRLNNL